MNLLIKLTDYFIFISLMNSSIVKSLFKIKCDIFYYILFIVFSFKQTILFYVLKSKQSKEEHPLPYDQYI